MKEIYVEDAVGEVLCHDITRIVAGVSKGPVFKKGHVITAEDVPVLLSVGKEHIFVWENIDGMIHENDAAIRLSRLVKGEFMTESPVSEGKINLFAEIDGVFKVDSSVILAINSLGDLMIATRHGNFPVKKGDFLAGMRAIPLMIDEKKLEEAETVAKSTSVHANVLRILPYKTKKVGIVATGSEVLKGRIEDTFSPVLKTKLAEFPCEILSVEYSGDDVDVIKAKIAAFLKQGADLVICTGGMSVDPDDRTPGAIRSVAKNVVAYGAPVLPGAMFMLAYTDENKAVMGIPGCAMYEKRTILDIVLPRIFADDTITAAELAALGEGGICLHCQQCIFPNCGFGK